MKILVVGGGGREHAIIRALKKSPRCSEIWCAPGNGGISYDAHCKAIPATDVDAMVKFAKEEAFDYVVVAQDDPLALGMVDALAAVGIPAFGPDKAAARIEASKVFSMLKPSLTQKIRQHRMPMLGQDAFGVELHALNPHLARKAGVAHALDFAVFAGGGDGQAGRDGVAVDRQ